MHLTSCRQEHLEGLCFTYNQCIKEGRLTKNYQDQDRYREMKMKIEAIRKSNGEITTDEESIKTIFLEHFQNLLQDDN